VQAGEVGVEAFPFGPAEKQRPQQVAVAVVRLVEPAGLDRLGDLGDRNLAREVGIGDGVHTGVTTMRLSRAFSVWKSASIWSGSGPARMTEARNDTRSSVTVTRSPVPCGKCLALKLARSSTPAKISAFSQMPVAGAETNTAERCWRSSYPGMNVPCNRCATVREIWLSPVAILVIIWWPRPAGRAAVSISR